MKIYFTKNYTKSSRMQFSPKSSLISEISMVNYVLITLTTQLILISLD